MTSPGNGPGSPERLRPATRRELVDGIADGLARGLRPACAGPAHPADDLLARIAAERLAEALEGRFVVLRRPPGGACRGGEG